MDMFDLLNDQVIILTLMYLSSLPNLFDSVLSVILKAKDDTPLQEEETAVSDIALVSEMTCEPAEVSP